MPDEFIFVSIQYFIGTVLPTKCCQKLGCGRKQIKVGGDRGLSIEGFQKFCTLWPMPSIKVLINDYVSLMKLYK